MSTDTLSTLIARQRDDLKNLREDARFITATITDQIWDRYEADIEELTEEGFMFECVSANQMSLSFGLYATFNAALEREVLSRFDAWARELAKTAGQEIVDTADIELSCLRKSIKIRRHADQLIGQALERARPGVGRVIGALVDEFIGDPTRMLDALDSNMKKDAERVREELLAQKDLLCERMTSEIFAVIQFARLAYAGKLDKHQHSTGTAAVVATPCLAEQ